MDRYNKSDVIGQYGKKVGYTSQVLLHPNWEVEMKEEATSFLPYQTINKSFSFL
jgi:hypothetical protein